VIGTALSGITGSARLTATIVCCISLQKKIAALPTDRNSRCSVRSTVGRVVSSSTVVSSTRHSAASGAVHILAMGSSRSARQGKSCDGKTTIRSGSGCSSDSALTARARRAGNLRISVPAAGLTNCPPLRAGLMAKQWKSLPRSTISCRLPTSTRGDKFSYAIETDLIRSTVLAGIARPIRRIVEAGKSHAASSGTGHDSARAIVRIVHVRGREKGLLLIGLSVSGNSPACLVYGHGRDRGPDRRRHALERVRP
jgi:hypothetical protein